MIGYRQILFHHGAHTRRVRTSGKFLFEFIEHCIVGLGTNFHFPARQIARVTFYTKPLRHAKRKPAVADALNTASYAVMFRANHDSPFRVGPGTHPADNVGYALKPMLFEDARGYR